MVIRAAVIALGLLTMVACVDGSTSLRDGGLTRPDGGPPEDSGPRLDAGDPDGGPADTGTPRDSGPEDTGILPPPPECTPGSELSCACEQGPGRQTCRSDGTLGA